MRRTIPSQSPAYLIPRSCPGSSVARPARWSKTSYLYQRTPTLQNHQHLPKRTPRAGGQRPKRTHTKYRRGDQWRRNHSRGPTEGSWMPRSGTQADRETVSTTGSIGWFVAGWLTMRSTKGPGGGGVQMSLLWNGLLMCGWLSTNGLWWNLWWRIPISLRAGSINAMQHHVIMFTHFIIRQ